MKLCLCDKHYEEIEACEDCLEDYPYVSIQPTKTTRYKLVPVDEEDTNAT